MKAELVQPEVRHARPARTRSNNSSQDDSIGVQGVGTITKSSERFGYLQQDSGEQDLFLLPRDCEAFGGQIPPKGTRVRYTVGVDQQKGLPKAQEIQPESEADIPTS